MMPVKKSLILFTSLFMLLIVCGNLQAGQVVDGPVAREHLEYSVQELLYREDFSALEKLAIELRTKKSRFPDGTWKLGSFYDAFFSPRENTPEGWKLLLAMIDKWRLMYPRSITGRVAAAKAWTGYSWYARGSGPARTVTDEGWRLMTERMQKALDLVDVKIADPAVDCPERHNLLLTIGKAQGWERQNYEYYFHRAVTFEPGYFSYYLQKADYLSPRWYGDERECQRFAQETYRLNPNSEGSILYMRILWSLLKSHDLESLEEPGVSWEKMKQGFLDAEKMYPNSPWLLNNFCRFAYMARDLETARPLIERIGNRPYLNAWDKRIDYELAREWAGVVGAREKQVIDELIKNGDTEEFHQKLQLASDGEPRYQFEVGVHYLDSKNYQEAAKWLTKAAKQGHPGAQGRLGTIYANGLGVKQDDREAAQWYLSAARLGNQEGRYFLGDAYYSGKGVEKDLIKAYSWYALSPEHHGDKLRSLKAILTPAQLKRAEEETGKLAVKFARSKETSALFVEKKQDGKITLSTLTTGKNLLLSTVSDEYAENWKSYGKTAMEKEGHTTVFVVRDGGGLHKKFNFPVISEGYVLLVGLASSERINANGSITGLPYISGYLMLNERITTYMNDNKLRLSEKTPNRWQVLSAIFPVNGRVDKVQLSLGQASRKDDPFDGSAARFKDLGVYYFKTMEGAGKFLEGYKSTHAKGN